MDATPYAHTVTKTRQRSGISHPLLSPDFFHEFKFRSPRLCYLMSVIPRTSNAKTKKPGQPVPKRTYNTTLEKINFLGGGGERIAGCVSLE